MKKINKFLLFPVLIVWVLAGCKKNFTDLYVNTNKPTSVPPSLVLTGVLNDMYDRPFSQTEVWDQYYLYNYDYYGNNRYDFGSASTYYTTLKNVLKMEDEAKTLGLATLNPYSALGKFFRAFFFTKMSLQLGDIPMTEALEGVGNLKPVYDPQKLVFQRSLAWLDTANTELGSLISSGNNSLAGDIYFNGDLKKWQKTVNTFRLRLLIELSKQEGDADLNIKQQFATIISDGNKYPLMADAGDNLQYVYVTPSNFYPNNPSNFGFDGSRNNMSATHIGLLTQLQDPRVFVVAEPARYYVDNMLQSPTSFSSFIGADPGQDLGIMYNDAGLQKFSFLNRKRYYSTFTGENSIQVGFAEMCFNIAEGINRGWSSGDAEAWYVKGIQASMAFYGIPMSGPLTVYFYRPGSAGVDKIQNYDTYTVTTDWTTYYNQALVKYAGNTATGLAEILKQKYLALFRHSGLEAYYNFRRTGVPAFSTGPGTGNSTRIALRFKYPASESSANTSNYEASLGSQFAGNDDINGLMWIIK
jgi:Starch-binding associating with outer membrane